MAPEQKPGGPDDGKSDDQKFTDLAAAAQSMRHIFNAYVLAGFNEGHAIYLVGVILGATIRANTNPGGGD